MPLPPTLPSPIAREPAEATLAYALPTRAIVARYAADYGCDVARYFTGLDEVGVYRCGQTGAKFFHPDTLAGDAAFYETLEARIPDYYDEAKWEHALAAGWLRPGERVLDIGCGRGGFLAKAKARGAVVTGLESNAVAAREAAGRGIEIVDELIEPHAARRPGHYDVVTAFQVLEHIAVPRPFVEAAIAAVRPGGTLVLAVPNDDGFIGRDRTAVLNGPPHHLNLWNRDSLTALGEDWGLELLRVEIEPLQHPGWFQAVMEEVYLPKGWRRMLWHRLGAAKLFARFVAENANGIAGHTIIAAYRKP